MAALDKGLFETFIALVSDEWRKTVVMPNLATREDASRFGDPAQKGETVSITDLAPMVATDVVPGSYPTVFADITPLNRLLTLNYHKVVSLNLSFKDGAGVKDGVIAMAARRAVSGLKEAIDLSFYTELTKYAYQTVGAAGTTPFASNLDILKTASIYLDLAKAPRDGDRYIVLNPWAYNNASLNTTFVEADKGGEYSTIGTGALVEGLGFKWYNSNNVPNLTSNSGTVATDGTGTAGTYTVTVDNGSDALSNVIVGDNITFAGHTQEYAVTSISATATEQVLTIFPALAVNVADNVSVTRKATHVLNYAFHKSAIQFASRPLATTLSLEANGNPIQTFIEQETGIPLTIQYVPGFAEETWNLMCLWGVTVTPGKEAALIRVLG